MGAKAKFVRARDLRVMRGLWRQNQDVTVADNLRNAGRDPVSRQMISE
jgi:hypothetical protein